MVHYKQLGLVNKKRFKIILPMMMTSFHFYSDVLSWVGGISVGLYLS